MIAEKFWGNYSGYWPLRKSINPEKFNECFTPWFSDNIVDEEASESIE